MPPAALPEEETAFSRDCESNDDPINPKPPIPLPEFGAEEPTAASADNGRNMEDEARDNARGR